MLLEGSREWLSLDQVDNENAGAKATGARRLAELAAKTMAPFSTPRGLVIPFGVMEKALGDAPQVAGEYSELVRQAESLEAPGRAPLLRRLAELVHQLDVPEEVRRQVQQSFGKDQALVFRSSANCEDLEQFAGTGLSRASSMLCQPKLNPRFALCGHRCGQNVRPGVDWQPVFGTPTRTWPS